MTDIINQIYVINLDNKPDKWEDIQLNFSETGLQLNRWSGINGKTLSDKQINKITTPLCNNICSYSMIGRALSHISLWRHIAKNNLTNVLVLEDDAYPVDNFDTQLKKYWHQVPKDWDMVYLGCGGSCQTSNFTDLIYKVFLRRENKPVYKNDKLMKNVFSPGFPISLYGYMLSNKGARKLISHPVFKNVAYHIDVVLSSNVLGNNFNAYVIRPNLIYQKMKSEYNDIQHNNHPLISAVGSKIKTSNDYTLDAMVSSQLMYNRAMGVSITALTIILFLISFIIGYFGSNTVKNWYVYLLALLYFLELLWKRKLYPKNIKSIVVEILIILSGIFLGEKVKSYRQ